VRDGAGARIKKGLGNAKFLLIVGKLKRCLGDEKLEEVRKKNCVLNRDHQGLNLATTKFDRGDVLIEESKEKRAGALGRRNGAAVGCRRASGQGKGGTTAFDSAHAEKACDRSGKERRGERRRNGSYGMGRIK